MRVRTTVGDPQSRLLEGSAECQAVGQNGRLQLSKLIGGGQLKTHRLSGDGVHVWSALLPGEYGAIQTSCELFQVGEDHAPARSAQ